MTSEDHAGLLVLRGEDSHGAGCHLVLGAAAMTTTMTRPDAAPGAGPAPRLARTEEKPASTWRTSSGHDDLGHLSRGDREPGHRRCVGRLDRHLHAARRGDAAPPALAGGDLARRPALGRRAGPDTPARPDCLPDDGEHRRDAGREPGRAIPRLLTEPLPYVSRPDLLAAPVVLVALVSLLTGLRLDTRARIGPVAGALALYLAGALLSAGETDPHGLLAMLLVALALAGWIMLDRRPDDARHRIATGLPVVAGLAVLVAAVALLPVGSAYQPREHVDPPVVSVETPSPLPRLGAWAANPDAELMRVHGDVVPLRLVTLRTYDGSQWMAATRYSPLGSVDERSLPDGEQRRQSTVTVELSNLGGPWLPTPGDPVEVSDRDAVVDLETGTLYDAEAGPETSYQVTGTADAPDPERLLAATVPSGAAASAYLQQPQSPFALATYGARITRDAKSPYERALAIEHAVEHSRTLSARATSGSTFWRIEQFLFGAPDTPGARVGTSEQFATSFALLARNAGLPTRIVVGFRPGQPEDDGTMVVRGSDALAWPEVYFNRLGSVPFSPTPSDGTFSDGRPLVAPDRAWPPRPTAATLLYSDGQGVPRAVRGRQHRTRPGHGERRRAATADHGRGRGRHPRRRPPPPDLAAAPGPQLPPPAPRCTRGVGRDPRRARPRRRAGRPRAARNRGGGRRRPAVRHPRRPPGRRPRRAVGLRSTRDRAPASRQHGDGPSSAASGTPRRPGQRARVAAVVVVARPAGAAALRFSSALEGHAARSRLREPDVPAGRRDGEHETGPVAHGQRESDLSLGRAGRELLEQGALRGDLGQHEPALTVGRVVPLQLQRHAVAAEVEEVEGQVGVLDVRLRRAGVGGARR